MNSITKYFYVIRNKLGDGNEYKLILAIYILNNTNENCKRRAKFKMKMDNTERKRIHFINKSVTAICLNSTVLQ